MEAEPDRRFLKQHATKLEPVTVVREGQVGVRADVPSVRGENWLFPLGHTTVQGCWMLPRTPGSHRQEMCCNPS